MTQQSKRVRALKVTRVVIKPIQCCRCKRIPSESDRIDIRDRSEFGGKVSTCPRCGGHSYFTLRADGKPTRWGDKQADEIIVTERRSR